MLDFSTFFCTFNRIINILKVTCILFNDYPVDVGAISSFINFHISHKV